MSIFKTTLDVLKNLEITCKEEKKVNLDEILDIFANPSIEHVRGF